ncbi:rhamnogalacturonan-hydrolase [Fomitiporia mediterranea MF3/22]|uniref:rhamnogalacturonan-hydrolase n=1 Tax=Fomitiporia mediterranea (strain MF3/22) TaxID=694068 RepID=UPI000440889A|nr:rhamnogalacturonan-hydrolase [Fomitiporia mediterranea MF3/22]EJD02525.1 rhamnogalacturonan-hydrolase [Fomitiporia mediterranea MF3/22]
MSSGLLRVLGFFLTFSAALAQLSGRVGPTTSTSDKQATICNVLDYGGEIGSSDIGPAIGKAFSDCVLQNSGSTLYVPAGNYNMQTWQNLSGGKKWAFQMDGVITRASTTTGNMIVITDADDFEFYSSNSAGAIQGLGYQCRNAGPRLIRIVTSTNFSVHDLILVDSPEFHLVIQEGSNGEIYNLAIRGANIGGSDGVDVWGTNHWIHDVEVTNRDECVTVKSPSTNILVERIWCNQSGGSAIGSLGTGTAIENILYRNVYTNGGNQIFLIKSWGGSGYLRNVYLQNFLSHNTAYGLDVDQYWSGQSQADGAGVQLSNITFDTWDGSVVDGVQRPPIQFICSNSVPCFDMTLKNTALWSNTGEAVNKCQSAFGTGSCLKSGTIDNYNVITTTVSRPPGFTSPPTLSGDLSEGFATDASIPIPTIPSTYYPGLPQISPLAKSL